MPITPFIPHPVTGKAFIGRQGLVRNLRGRIAKGESVAVIGGPKLGKTSLVRSALEGLPHRRVIEVDLRMPPPDQFTGVSGAIVILDNLDEFADSTMGPLLSSLSSAGAENFILTGGHRLRALLEEPGTLAGLTFRLYPLSVLLDGEVRELIGKDQPASIAMWTGNHPYLTKLFLHYGEAALTEGRSQWEPFVQQLAIDIGEGPERRLLGYLIERGTPVNPTLAGSETGIPNIKAVADRLVYQGAISRWIRNDEATLFAGCRLLNDFVTGRTSELMA